MPKSKNATEERHERLAEELHAVAEHAQALASATGAELAAKSQEIQDRIEGVLEMARSAGAEIQEKATRGVRATDTAIRRHPYRSIGLALGAGLLIGLWLRRK